MEKDKKRRENAHMINGTKVLATNKSWFSGFIGILYTISYTSQVEIISK